jgi:hypothetical protein
MSTVVNYTANEYQLGGQATVNQQLTVQKDRTLEKFSIVAKCATTAALDQQAKKESRKKGGDA